MLSLSSFKSLMSDYENIYIDEKYLHDYYYAYTLRVYSLIAKPLRFFLTNTNYNLFISKSNPLEFNIFNELSKVINIDYNNLCTMQPSDFICTINYLYGNSLNGNYSIDQLIEIDQDNNIILKFESILFKDTLLNYIIPSLHNNEYKNSNLIEMYNRFLYLLEVKTNKEFIDYYELMYIYNLFKCMGNNISKLYRSLLTEKIYNLIQSNLKYYFYAFKFIIKDRTLISNYVIDQINSLDHYDQIFDKLLSNYLINPTSQQNIFNLLYLSNK